jgi:hypothetical protein
MVPVRAQAAETAAVARTLQIDITGGFNSILSNDELVKKNQGAEIGLLATLPFALWKEDANLVAVRGQFTSFSNSIAAVGDNGNDVKLANASHAQIRFDFRQIFIYWGVHWSAGLGFQVPITTNILTPRGELSFADAKNYYSDGEAQIAKIDRSFAGYLRLGIDQKLLSDVLILGAAFEIALAESPKTNQRFILNFYAGARIW